MIRVLFVCLGNICRSPMAEAVLRHKVKLAGLEDQITVDSAGTGDWHAGEPPHVGTRRILQARGVSYEGMQARQIRPTDLDDFDYILTMDNSNLANVRAVGSGSATIRPFLEYSPESEIQEVPDPYYTGGFEGVYSMIEAASDGFLATVRKEHSL